MRQGVYRRSLLYAVSVQVYAVFTHVYADVVHMGEDGVQHQGLGTLCIPEFRYFGSALQRIKHLFHF